MPRTLRIRLATGLLFLFCCATAFSSDLKITDQDGVSLQASGTGFDYLFKFISPGFAAGYLLCQFDAPFPSQTSCYNGPTGGFGTFYLFEPGTQIGNTAQVSDEIDLVWTVDETQSSCVISGNDLICHHELEVNFIINFADWDDASFAPFEPLDS